jgi:hypothetical protein
VPAAAVELLAAVSTHRYAGKGFAGFTKNFWMAA